MTDSEVLMFRNSSALGQVAVLENGNKFRIKKIQFKKGEVMVLCSDGTNYAPDQIKNIFTCADVKTLQSALSAS